MQMASWYYIVAKSSILDDLWVVDQPVVFFFSMRNITKEIKI